MTDPRVHVNLTRLQARKVASLAEESDETVTVEQFRSAVAQGPVTVRVPYTAGMYLGIGRGRLKGTEFVIDGEGRVTHSQELGS